MLCLNTDGELADILRADGIAVHVLRKGGGRADYLSGFRVAKFVREHRIDVLHSHNTQPFLDSGLAAHLVRNVALVHTDHARDFPDKWRYMILEHLMSWAAYRVVGVSEHTTENLRRFEYIPRRKLVTIPNGIDGRAFEVPFDRMAVRSSLGVPPDACVIVFASRLESQKDVPNLLRAFREVAARDPLRWLVVAGQGSLRGELEALAVELGVQQRVRFVGVRLDVADVLRASDVFVLSSRWEGLPMVILEALAAGCPIVSTDVGGVPSAITNGEHGLLVPPEDHRALAAGLERMCSLPGLRTTLATAGRKRFLERYSAAAMTQQYERLYRQAAEARGSA